jgi:hypothetical protein
LILEQNFVKKIHVSVFFLLEDSNRTNKEPEKETEKEDKEAKDRELRRIQERALKKAEELQWELPSNKREQNKPTLTLNDSSEDLQIQEDQLSQREQEVLQRMLIIQSQIVQK